LKDKDIISSKEGFKNLVEPRIWNRLGECSYTISTVPAHTLLSRNRFDLGIKLWYLEAWNNNHQEFTFAEDAYEDHIRAFNYGKFQEPGNEKKKGISYFKEVFQKIYKSIAQEGFNDALSIIPLAQNGEILNGAHRVAAAIHLNLKVRVVYTDLPSPWFNFSFFVERDVYKPHLMMGAFYFARFSQNALLSIALKPLPTLWNQCGIWKGKFIAPPSFFNRIEQWLRHAHIDSSISAPKNGRCILYLHTQPAENPIPNALAHFNGEAVAWLLNMDFLKGLSALSESDFHQILRHSEASNATHVNNPSPAHSANTDISHPLYTNVIEAGQPRTQTSFTHLTIPRSIRRIQYFFHFLKYKVLKFGGYCLRTLRISF